MKLTASVLTPELVSLLDKSGLPTSDLGNHIHFIIITDNEKLIGVAGLQAAGTDALIRSVAVETTHRNLGLGKQLTREIIEMARHSGYRTLWLLTTTAGPFFEEMGFHAADRSEAPESVKNTTEFLSVCPSSASCMKMDLKS